ncbi:hypothetical protein ANCCEY_09578 [Ancylostoma ceylanicum]|uniref:Uncharacterized protein n=1 Tax=Ancylostoma ceylanicum TaxID=53326 RepID=A0A0D6LMS4_9BILA|nr:hypothetical protein ANCCEY_09578 [Ancylostoma ceylanicum]
MTARKIAGSSHSNSFHLVGWWGAERPLFASIRAGDMPLQMPKPQSQHRHHRVDALWDSNADKYRVACRSVHVMRATQFIGYGQLLVIGLFTITLLFFYGKQLNGGLPADHWLSNAVGFECKLSQTFAQGLQLLMDMDVLFSKASLAVVECAWTVLMMLHGVRSQRRSFLLPFIIFASFAVFLAFIQNQNLTSLKNHPEIAQAIWLKKYESMAAQYFNVYLCCPAVYENKLRCNNIEHI